MTDTPRRKRRYKRPQFGLHAYLAGSRWKMRSNNAPAITSLLYPRKQPRNAHD